MPEMTTEMTKTLKGIKYLWQCEDQIAAGLGPKPSMSPSPESVHALL
jgi:hypothetical protein